VLSWWRLWRNSPVNKPVDQCVNECCWIFKHVKDIDLIVLRPQSLNHSSIEWMREFGKRTKKDAHWCHLRQAQKIKPRLDIPTIGTVNTDDVQKFAKNKSPYFGNGAGCEHSYYWTLTEIRMKFSDESRDHLRWWKVISVTASSSIANNGRTAA